MTVFAPLIALAWFLFCNQRVDLRRLHPFLEHAARPLFENLLRQALRAGDRRLHETGTVAHPRHAQVLQLAHARRLRSGENADRGFDFCYYSANRSRRRKSISFSLLVTRKSGCIPMEFSTCTDC